jgi:hypothetical protein
MKATKRLFLTLCVVVLAGAAQESSLAPATGKVLILDNERAIDGEIVLKGEEYSVRRGKAELSVPAAKVLRLCASWEDALGFMKSRANLQDADERLRLARWCERHALLEHALAEVNAALTMRPAHQGARQLQAFLQKTLALQQNQTTGSPAHSGVVPMPAIDIGSESLALFNNKVHPILMNTCVQCHTQGRGARFQLSRGYEGGVRAAMQRNLAAAIAQLDAKQPALSPLLIKAAAAHGNSDQSPLQGGRKSVPYQTLEAWVQMVVSNNPHLRELSAPGAAAAEKPAAEKPATGFSSTSPQPRRLPRDVTEPVEEKGMPAPVRDVERIPSPAQLAPGTPVAARVVPVHVQAPAAPPESMRAPGVAPPPTTADPSDPFDPAVFNQQLRRDR